MPQILEPTHAENERSLSDILQNQVPEKYWITQNSIDRLLKSEGAKMFSRCASRGRAGFPWKDLEPALLSQVRVRKLTPLESERAMGFPDNWTEGFSDNVRYLMTGNAAAVSVAESIAESIKDIFLKEG
jgi:site-specific DNA-cytosine methylase